MRYTIYSNTNTRFIETHKEMNNLEEAMAYAKTLKGFNNVWINDNYSGKIYTIYEKVL